MRRTSTLVVAALLGLGGCGGDDDDAAKGGDRGGGTAPLTLTADPGGELSWAPADLSATAGAVAIELVNDSPVPHAVEVEGNGVEEASEEVTRGRTTLTVDLEAGTYTVYCPVGNHADAGMTGTLTVR